MRLQGRVARLERVLPPPRAPSPEELLREERSIKVLRRWCKLLREAVPLMSGAEQEQVDSALRDVKQGPYKDWLWHLEIGWSRLPVIKPEAMKALLLTWLSPQVDDLSRVCKRCGLEYPSHKSPPMSEWKVLPGKRPLEGLPPWYDLPEFFHACPGCGASRYEITYPHLVWDQDHPWKKLDGYVGAPR